MIFLQNMYTVLVQVLILAVLVTVGFFGDRLGFFTEKAARLSNNLLFYVITPCVIVNSFLSIEYSKQNASSFFIAFGCACAFHIVAIILSFFTFNKGDKDKNVLYKYATVYGNAGYMGLPLSMAVMQTVAGNASLGAFYCSAFVAVFNLFSFSHGVWLMSGDNGSKFDFKKIFLNPGLISIAVGIPLFLLQIKLPQIILTPVSHLGNMNTPLAMLMFGTYLSKADFTTVFKQKNMYLAAFIKLVLLPLVMIFAFRLAGITGNLLIVLSVGLSAPTANNTVMFAAKFNRDTSLASQLSGFTSILAVITMPACVALAIILV